MYAIIETGGKQYKVTPGQVIEVDYLGLDKGIPVELDRILLVGDDAKVTVGTPVVEGAKVSATSQGGSKGEKIVVFKYKSKVRYRRKKGHRQPYTRLLIDRIVESGATESEPAAPKARRRKKEVTESGA